MTAAISRHHRRDNRRYYTCNRAVRQLLPAVAGPSALLQFVNITKWPDPSNVFGRDRPGLVSACFTL